MLPSHLSAVPDDTVWRIAHDVAAGLDHIHACGIVHLDVKPANLLITQEGTIRYDIRYSFDTAIPYAFTHYINTTTHPLSRTIKWPTKAW